MKISMAFLVMAFICISVSNGYSEPTTWFCSYDTMSTDKGFERLKDKFELKFIINEHPEKSYLVGNNGSAQVRIVGHNTGAFTAIEVTSVGNVMTTTITEDGTSVHSRNTYALGVLMPSQSYGVCQKK